MADESEIKPLDGKNHHDTIDSIVVDAGQARPSGRISDIYYGIDHRGVGSAFQKNTDSRGLVFFTRPGLNLSYDNIIMDRTLLPLLAEDSKSIYRAIRVMLDPRLNEKSDLIDPKSAFMPIFTNTLLTLSGFDDPVLNTYTSPEGIRKEAYSIIDDVAETNRVFTITGSFANVAGNPVKRAIYYWMRYGGNVYSGDMLPYPIEIYEDRKDYESRVFRITLDKSKRFITGIASTIVFPVAAPLGADYNYDFNTPFMNENDQFSVPFQAQALEYDDVILYYEFNAIVEMFNPSMADGKRETHYRKISHTELNGLNFYGYPHINTQTLELEWWISRAEYKLIAGA